MAPPFSLAAVLRLRERKEEEEERALVAIGTHRRQLEETLRRVEHELMRWTAQRTQEIGTVSNAATQQANYARYKALSDARAQVHEQIRKVDAQREAQQKVYLAARREREMLTELKKQQTAKWDVENARREARTIADLFTGRSRRE